jgi:hypothetical protein
VNLLNFRRRYSVSNGWRFLLVILSNYSAHSQNRSFVKLKLSVMSLLRAFFSFQILLDISCYYLANLTAQISICFSGYYLMLNVWKVLKTYLIETRINHRKKAEKLNRFNSFSRKTTPSKRQDVKKKGTYLTLRAKEECL